MVNILEQVDQTRFCSPCQTRKPLSSFHKGSRRCKVCQSAYHKSYQLKPENIERQRSRDRMRSPRPSVDKDLKRNQNLRCRFRKYGTTLAAVEEMTRLQNNRCRVCGIKMTKSGPAKACTDHCHKTKHLRSILCLRCNFVEGQLGSVKVARQMLAFMEQNEFLSYRE